MATIFANSHDAEAYAQTLTLSSDGLPPLTEPKEKIAGLIPWGVMVGRDVFSLERYMEWADKRERNLIQQAAGSNNFSAAGPCPINDDEFGKYAPDIMVALFLTPEEAAKLPAGLGQRLRCKKKWGKPKLNPKTGKMSGGAYRSGAFGYWFGGVVSQTVVVPGRGPQVVRYRPTINMAAEKSGAGQGSNQGGPQTGEPEEDSELEE